MKRVYTKTGDKGTTGIHGGARVPKDDIRIEANGCLDELNAVIGIVRSMLAAKDAWQELLHAVQRELMVVMSHVATPSGVVNPNPLSAAELTLRCEQEMDAMMREGLLEEVKSLVKDGCGREIVSMQGIGYKEFFDYFDGNKTLEEAVEQVKLDTRHFAKRQLTWFRREKDVIWLNKGDYEGEDALLEEMLRITEEKGIYHE